MGVNVCCPMKVKTYQVMSFVQTLYFDISDFPQKTPKQLFRIHVTSWVYVVDRCPFGDQPVVPGSVGCADRVYGRPYDCYLPSLNAACCLSCEEIKTDITGKYSDISNM